MRALRGWMLAVLVTAAVAVAVAACGGDGDAERTTLRVQLDWLPNTNHIGVYVALEKGWYAEEGLEVDVLPYAANVSDVVVANGAADLGFSVNGVPFTRSVGLPVQSVAAVLQRRPTELAVLGDGPVARPRDLAGKLYAGFGQPYELPQVRAVIDADGGDAEVRSAILNTAAYEALYNGEADVSEIFVTWEGIEARLRAIDLRTFNYSDFGVPEFHTVLLVASDSVIEDKGDALRRFLEVTRRGYEFAAEAPEAAADLLIEAVGADTFPNTEMVYESAALLAGSYFVDDDGRWGRNSPQQWNAYVTWLAEQGLLLDEDGDPIAEPEADAMYTNDYLPD